MNGSLEFVCLFKESSWEFAVARRLFDCLSWCISTFQWKWSCCWSTEQEVKEFKELKEKECKELKELKEDKECKKEKDKEKQRKNKEILYVIFAPVDLISGIILAVPYIYGHIGVKRDMRFYKKEHVTFAQKAVEVWDCNDANISYWKNAFAVYARLIPFGVLKIPSKGFSNKKVFVNRRPLAHPAMLLWLFEQGHVVISEFYNDEDKNENTSFSYPNIIVYKDPCSILPFFFQIKPKINAFYREAKLRCFAYHSQLKYLMVSGTLEFCNNYFASAFAFLKEK